MRRAKAARTAHREQTRALNEARETMAAAVVRSRMLAEQIVFRDHEVVTMELHGRTYMVEVKAFDVTDTPEEHLAV